MLSAEHASVLDEIDLLRGKLSQLERNVLSAAALTTGSGNALPADLGGGVSDAAAAAVMNVHSLLASLTGLGEEVVADLPAVGSGPSARLVDDASSSWSDPLIAAGDAATPLGGTAGLVAAQPGSARSEPGEPGGGSSSDHPVPRSRSALSGGGPGSTLAAAAKTIINRTPLSNRATSDVGLVDSISVANSGLAGLLAAQPTGSVGSSTQANSRQPLGRSPSPKQVSFVDRWAAGTVDPNGQLPSSATATSSAINRPLPHKPLERPPTLLHRVRAWRQS